MKSPKLELQRALRHVAARFPQDREPVLTDIALRVFPHSGEVRFYDDEEQELMRIVIPEWIKGSCDEAFYDKVAPVLRQVLADSRKDIIDKMLLLRPFSFTMQDEEGDTLTDLYIVDDDETMIISGDLLEDLDKDLDSFLDDLMKD